MSKLKSGDQKVQEYLLPKEEGDADTGDYGLLSRRVSLALWLIIA